MPSKTERLEICVDAATKARIEDAGEHERAGSVNQPAPKPSPTAFPTRTCGCRRWPDC